MYCKNPTFLWANSLDPDQTASEVLKEQYDLGLHCLPFHLHLLDVLLCGKTAVIVQILG